ncbi:NEW3 domain-containing protein [Salinicola sp. DM10]|uniref:COG1470 family protein n=1 Tax=Salinicola sp. DM10 TaxID=2815721 RepID=UPI001A8EB3B4|nr:NEW3 domain-containing protein [Salinicola sp. DM10]MCE3026628.1 NEW3 domain-containing protein [Salinicola sp. DM10]
MTLSTPYPEQALGLKDTIDIPLEIDNAGLDPQAVQLSVDQLPPGWKAHFMGDDRDIGSVFVGHDASRTATLVVEPGKDAKEQHSYALRLVANGEGGHRSTLPLTLTFDKTPPAALDMSATLPTLKGSASTDFTYHLTLDNKSLHAVDVNLSADAPEDFQVDFSPQYGAESITSLPLKAGESKQLDVKVHMPPHMAAATYPIKVHATAGELNASVDLQAVVSGSPRLTLSTPSGQLSGSVYAGEQTSMQWVLTNTGSAPAHNVKLSAEAPQHWQVKLVPDTIDTLAPGDRAKINATLSPSDKSLAGDFMVGFDARADQGAATASADYRATVSTSTMWGMVGVLIVLAALLVVGFAVMRFGRR